MTAPIDLNGRDAIVTGGASGIGLATARMFAAAGARVVLTDVDIVDGQRAADQMGASFVHQDVSDATRWNQVVAEHGPFDIAFLNAGISTDSGAIEIEATVDMPIVGLSDDAYRQIMSVNVDGVVFGARAVLPAMIERGHGDIVVTASMAGLGPIAMDPIYGLTKHAVVGFVRSVAAGVLRHATHPDICVSAICPGFTDTKIVGDGIREFLNDVGMELMSPDGVAAIVGRSLTERVQGAQWVIWPGQDARVYEWAPAIESDFEINVD